MCPINLLDGVEERGQRDGFFQVQVGSGLSTGLVVMREGVRFLHEDGRAGPTMGPLYGPYGTRGRTPIQGGHDHVPMNEIAMARENSFGPGDWTQIARGTYLSRPDAANGQRWR